LLNVAEIINILNDLELGIEINGYFKQLYGKSVPDFSSDLLENVRDYLAVQINTIVADYHKFDKYIKNTASPDPVVDPLYHMMQWYVELFFPESL